MSTFKMNSYNIQSDPQKNLFQHVTSNKNVYNTIYFSLGRFCEIDYIYNTFVNTTFFFLKGSNKDNYKSYLQPLVGI